jgi:hypothetical protein
VRRSGRRPGRLRGRCGRSLPVPGRRPGRSRPARFRTSTGPVGAECGSAHVERRGVAGTSARSAAKTNSGPGSMNRRISQAHAARSTCTPGRVAHFMRAPRPCRRRRGIRPRTGPSAGRGHDTSGTPLSDLAPQFAPQRHWTPDGSCPRARAKEPVRAAAVEIFRPTGNCPTSVRPRHTGSDLGFYLRAELRTFSRPGKRSSDWQAKKPPDLQSPLTESNRRPSPYHGPPDGPCKRRGGFEQAERWLTLAETSPGQPLQAAFCPPKCPR